MIAFFGMGLLGSGFVRALERRGEEVRVWNRSPEKARALASDRVRAFDDPAEAARGAARVHLALSDDAAVDAVLDAAKGGFSPGVHVIDHTTTSAAGVPGRIARWSAAGVGYLHAPVFMGPKNALDSTGFMLVSGDPARIEPVRPALEAMTGKLLYVGERDEAAAGFKLMGNLFLMFLTAGLADVLALAKSLGIGPSEAIALFDHFNPGAQVPARARRMAGGEFDPPSWSLAMARKDARLMLEEAERAGVPLAVLPSIAARMDAVIAEGNADLDWTVIGRDAVPGPADRVS